MREPLDPLVHWMESTGRKGAPPHARERPP
jgi:hypothetical protein